ncbi:non-ribosomal peptide synthetase [Amycolatopsis sp. cmx-4-54]|uniref:non-ribosomal peptide synthetase n=1 Tax=Amycolatopsis sp. cmx-4-54 TaxID=2790936 RepID=UPI00397DF380
MTAPFTGDAPASPAQQRLWLVHQQGPRGVEFSFPYRFDVHGPCRTDRLTDAFAAVVARHTPLRTTFALDGDVLVQRVHAPGSAFCVRRTVRDAAEAGEWIADEVGTPFDLASDWPIRVRVYEIGPAECVVLLNVHHIATDGVSMRILMDEVAAFYRGDEPAPIGLPYARRRFDDRTPEPAAVEYWREVVADAPEAVRLPTARPVERRSFSGRWADRDVPADRVAGLERLAASAGASLYSALFGLLAIALTRRTGTADVVLGVPFAGRAAGEENLIGFFVNLLPVRFRVNEAGTFEDLCASAGEVVTGALEHSHLPLDRVLTESGVRPGGLNPLLDVTLTEEDTPRLELAGLRVETRELRLDVARYHLAFDYRRTAGGLRFEVSYAKDQLDRADVTAVLDDLVALIEAATDDPGARPAALPATGPVSVLHDPDPVAVPDSLETCWRAVLANHFDAVAVMDRAGSVTFGELDALSRVLAARLGSVAGQQVAVLCTRSRDFPVAVLGVLRAGATPMLLDAAQPEARLAALTGNLATVCSAGLARDGAVVVPADGNAPDVWAGRPADGLAYAIYTSGSIGTPKCVGVTDRGLSMLLANLSALGLCGPGQRLALNASFGFDASVQQWVRLFGGSTIVVLDEDTRLDPVDLVERLVSDRVTELDISPRHLEAVLDVLLSRFAGSRARLRLLIGGEAIPPGLWARLRAADTVVAWNMYGPTETAVDATVYPLALSPDPTIGLPLPGVRAYVLDAWLRPVPPGTPGTLYLAGPGLARGYLGAPGRTATAFVPDPLACDGSRMYDTGDRVRLRADGCLEYLGRLDGQVKVSGFRVERAEVEHAVLAQPGVTACAVLLDDEGSDPALHLYVVCAPDIPAVLPGRLRAVLPSQMVPSRITRVERIPLTARGKLDRARLTAAPEPVADPIAEPAAPQESGATEVIAAVWRTVLGRTDIRPEDDFFSLGGHSLLAIRVIARLHKDMDLKLPISTVFDYPVLQDLADHVEQQVRARA